MPNQIIIPIVFKEKIVNAINVIQGEYPPIQESLNTLAAACSLEETVINLSEDEFDLLRQKLLAVLNNLTQVTVHSQQLWLILKCMARIHPLNQQDPISLDAVPINGESTKGWYFASSGHVLQLKGLLKLQTNNSQFYNPYIASGYSAKAIFNCHDQKKIRLQAEKSNITIPNPGEDAIRFINGLTIRTMLTSANFMQEVLRKGPAICAAIKKEFSQRTVFSGSKEFFDYLFYEFDKTLLLLNIAPICCYCFANDSMINSIFRLMGASLIITAITCYFTDICKKMFVLLDAPIVLFGVVMIFLNYSIVKLKEINQPNQPNQLNQQMIRGLQELNKKLFPSVISFAENYFIPFIQSLNNYLPGGFLLFYLEGILKKINILFNKLAIAKFEYEVIKFEKTPEGQDGKVLLMTGMQLLRNYQEQLHQGMTHNVMEYLQEINNQIITILTRNPDQMITGLQQMMFRM